MNKRNLGYYALGCMVFALLLILIVEKRDTSQVAKEAVRCLYEFTTSFDWERQDAELKNLCSEGVYTALTTEMNGSLHTYIEKSASPCMVIYDEITPSYIIFHLQTEMLDSERTFVWFYKTSLTGKIVEVRECELYDFINSR